MIIWKCSVIDRNLDRDVLPEGADLPMRHVVGEAFKAMLGRHPEAISSGWGYYHLSEVDAAVLDGRMPDLHRQFIRNRMAALLIALEIPMGDDFTVENERYTAALDALTDAVYAVEHARRPR